MREEIQLFDKCIKNSCIFFFFHKCMRNLDVTIIFVNIKVKLGVGLIFFVSTLDASITFSHRVVLDFK